MMWWHSLTTIQQICFVTGCVSDIFMVIPFVHSAIRLKNGGLANGGSNMQNDGVMSDLKTLSVRACLIFICALSWAGYVITFYLPSWAALLIGSASGAVAVLIVALALRTFKKHQNKSGGNAAESSVEVEASVGPFAKK